jgi:hypothetical protein
MYCNHIPHLYAARHKWIRLNKTETSSLLKEAYKCNTQIHETNTDTWITSIRYILRELNLESFWLNKPINEDHLIPKVKKLLKNRYKNYWLACMHDDNRPKRGEKNKLRTYRQFKIIFETEKYLETVMIKEHKHSLIKFRISNHNLHIERGRYTNLAIHLRKCQMCPEMEIEDEFHFLITCPRYRENRNDLYASVQQIFQQFLQLSDYEKFIWLMSSKHTGIVKRLAAYLYNCSELRKVCLS